MGGNHNRRELLTVRGIRAISSASVGDTVQVPAGSCSWSGLSIAKAVHLRGAGVGKTNITLSGENSIIKQSSGVVRISGFSFTKSGGGSESKGFGVSGSWKNAEPVVIENNSFQISNSGLFRLSVAGDYRLQQLHRRLGRFIHSTKRA